MTTKFSQIIVAGDSNANPPLSHLMLLRVDSGGNSSNLDVVDLPTFQNGKKVTFEANLITNADTGALISWGDTYILIPDARPKRASRPARRGRADVMLPTPLRFGPTYGMAITNGTAVTTITSPAVAGQVTNIAPMLQREDGSFVGVVGVGDESSPQYNTVVFTASGSVLWSVPSETPQIATADGGVIGQSGIAYDQNGNAAGQVGSLPTYSWKGAYVKGSVDSEIPFFDLAFMAQSNAAVPNGNLTGNGFSLVHHTFGLVFCGPTDGSCTDPVTGLPVTNVAFSYLPNLSDANHTQPVDFSQAFPGWVSIIKSQAYNAYKAAFSKLPAIVRNNTEITPLYGGSTTVEKFEHTNMISGGWFLMGFSYPPTGNTENGTNSFVYYLAIMGNAQNALGFVIQDSTTPPGTFVPVSPVYSPPPATMTPSVLAQFNQLVSSIGWAIGNVAAHETGHQLSVADLDCGNTNGCPGNNNHVYQYYGAGSNAVWFYAAAPGIQITWTPNGICSLIAYLLPRAPCN